MYYIIINDVAIDGTMDKLTTMFFPCGIVVAYIIKKHSRQTYVKTFVNIIIFVMPVVCGDKCICN